MNNAHPLASLKDTGLFRQQAFVGGAWRDPDSGRRIGVTYPATGAVIGSVPDLAVDETRIAIDAAESDG